jgi:RNA polymerase sigma-70 factor (ECF subfamily)
MLGLTTARTTGKSPGWVFAEFYQEHYPLMYRLAKSITGCREDAQDVVQTVFSEILRREFDTRFLKNPKAYLCRSAVNGAIQLVKSRGRRMFTDDDVEYLRDPGAGSSENDDDTIRRLHEALDQLSPDAIQMLLLRYKQDMSDADIGKMLGKSRGTVAVTLYRARARIKKLLRNSEEEKRHETR